MFHMIDCTSMKYVSEMIGTYLTYSAKPRFDFRNPNFKAISRGGQAQRSWIIGEMIREDMKILGCEILNQRMDKV